MSYQVLVIGGRVGRDPESKFLANGTQLTNFSVAVDEGFGERKKTIWFNVTAWNKQAEAVEKYVAKGQEVTVVGRVNDVRAWPTDQTDENGKVICKTKLEITAERVIFGSKNQGKPKSDEGDDDGLELSF